MAAAEQTEQSWAEQRAAELPLESNYRYIVVPMESNYRYRPPPVRIYRYVVHFEADGEEILVGLPDEETVQLLTTTATRCMCPRCLVSDPEGRSLVCNQVIPS